MKSQSYLNFALAIALSLAIYPASLLAHDGPHAQSVSIPHLMVEDLDAALAFYNGVLGFELTRPLGEPMPNQMAGNGEGRMRVMIVGAPAIATSFELVEWSNIPTRSQQLSIYDPGAFMIAVSVPDITRMLDGARELGLEILTEDGDYIVRGGVNKYAMIRDADGYTVELVETESSRMQAGISNVAWFLTVENLDETVEFYNQAFGLQMAAPGAAGSTPEYVTSLFDNDELLTMRMARGTFPNTEFTLNFQEFTGPERRKANGGVEDPGEALLLISVDNFPMALEKINEFGGIVGLGSMSAELPEGVNYSWGHDPNGMLLRISPPADR
tara:strand:- start:1508 stop:2491 length:984 start_codon:yes stop_codon:yes gene_type:complete